MSSQMGGIGGGIGGGIARSLESFARGRKSRDPFEGMEEWELLRAAGGSDDMVEAQRLKERLYGETGLLASSEAIGIEQDQNEKKGIVSGVADFILRGGSASVGFLSGLAGMERVRKTSEGGEFLSDEERSVEGGLTLAFERFKQGITGEEQFRSADFGLLAYDRETAPTWERAVKATAGFVLDTALDPTTYMSMGGSIFGRVAGAKRVWGAARTKNRANVLEMIDTKNADELLDIVRRTPEKFGASTQKVAAELGEALRARGIEVTDNIARLNMKSITNILEKNPEMLRDFAADMVSANMAISYRGGSSWGLKGYLKSEFGDAGMQAYRALPLDIQGGIRMRVPFSSMGGRDPKVLFRIPGTEGLSALTNGTRDYLRNTIPGFRTLAADAAGGLGLTDKRVATAYYRSLHDTSRRVWGEWVPETGTIGWLDVQDAKRAFAEADNVLSEFTSKITSVYVKATHHVDKGRKLAKEEGKDFNELFYNGALIKRVSGRLGDDGSITPNQTIVDVFGKNPSPAQIEAYHAAVDLQTINQMVLDRGQHIWDGDHGRFLQALGMEGEYFPRIVKDMEQMLRNVKRRGKKKPDVLFDRDRFFTMFEDGNVANWLNNKQIADRFGDIFEIDPEKVMLAYMTAVTRSMRDEQITRNLIRAGIAFKGVPVRDALNADKVSEAARQVLLKMNARKAAAEQIDYVANPEDARQVYQALLGWRGLKQRVYTHYRPVTTKLSDDVAEAFVSIDGTRIERLAGPLGGFRVRGAKGKFLTETGEWGATARVFARRSDAQDTANNVLRDVRNRDYQDRAQELLDEFKSVIADDLKRLDELNPLSFQNLPLGKEEMEEHIVAIINVIRDLGEAKGFSFYSRPINGARYKELTSRSGLGVLGEATALDTKVRGGLVERWNNLGLLTPAALIDDVQRLGAARSEMSKFMTDFYLPFYAVQKSLMTSQRGPGYVVRNIIGGMWNAYLYGVKAKHWKGAAVVLSARNEAYDWAKKQWPEGDIRQADAAMKKFSELLEKRLGKSAGEEMFRYYQGFDRLQLGGRSIRSRTLGIRTTELYDNLPEDVVRALNDGNTSKFLNTLDYVGSRNRWAQFMTRQATESEDFLRFGSFLRGIDDYGFGDGGQLASMYTLGSQFDYTDLSKFERERLKLIMPFYTWSRNNIPLQFRAMLSEPGKVARAIRINDSLKDAFGEPGEEEPLPVWIRQNMGWQIRSDLVTGPMGDPLAFGLTVGEPLQDLNNIFGAPQEGVKNLVNWREVINSLNPAFATAVTAFTGVEQATGGRLPATEPAPPWAKPFVRAGMFGRVTPEGEEIVSARTLRVLRDTLAPFGAVERLAPQFFGNERYQRRVLSSWASTLFGVPLRTLDPFQTGAELRSRQNRMQSELKLALGDDWNLYTDWVAALVERGATAADMAIVRETVLGLAPNQDIASLSPDRIDYTAARETLEMLRRIERLQEIGISESVIRRVWENFEPRTDKQTGRGFYSQARQSVPEDVIAAAGLDISKIDRMSREELLAFLQQVSSR
jgi:hypothetical protein